MGRFILAVTGWRFHNDKDLIHDSLDFFRGLRRMSLHIRVGDASGADAFTLSWCRTVNVSHHIYRANWTAFGKRAGPIRNGKMLRGVEEDNVLADMLLAFPEPKCKPLIPGSGSWGCILEASELGIPVIVSGEEGVFSKPW